jgi:hypothetical protein
MTESVFAICEGVAEVQALLHDHIECGKHTAADVVAKAQAVLSESALLRAMFDVGYFPPNTPPPVNRAQTSVAPELCCCTRPPRGIFGYAPRARRAAADFPDVEPANALSVGPSVAGSAAVTAHSVCGGRSNKYGEDH